MQIMRTHVLGADDPSHGNRDSIILQIPSEKSKRVIGIIDCAHYEDTKSYLEDWDLIPDRVEFVVATHPHDDHIEGMWQLLEYFREEDIEIGAIWESGYIHNTKAYKNLQKCITLYYTDRTIYPKEDTNSIDFGQKFIVNFLAPKSSGEYNKSQLNNSSIVLFIQYSQAKLLFGADAQSESWGRILSGQKEDFLGGGFMKVPHHGSWRGTSFENVHDYFNPRVAVITTNRQADSECHGTHCFPHPVVVGIYKSIKQGCQVCSTYDMGDVVVESNRRGSHTVVSPQNLPGDIWKDIWP